MSVSVWVCATMWMYVEARAEFRMSSSVNFFFFLPYCLEIGSPNEQEGLLCR